MDIDSVISVYRTILTNMDFLFLSSCIHWSSISVDFTMKESFEQRLERQMKQWKQQQYDKETYGDPDTEEVEWKIVSLGNGGFIRRPFKIK